MGLGFHVVKLGIDRVSWPPGTASARTHGASLGSGVSSVATGVLALPAGVAALGTILAVLVTAGGDFRQPFVSRRKAVPGLVSAALSVSVEARSFETARASGRSALPDRGIEVTKLGAAKPGFAKRAVNVGTAHGELHDGSREPPARGHGLLEERREPRDRAQVRRGRGRR